MDCWAALRALVISERIEYSFDKPPPTYRIKQSTAASPAGSARTLGHSYRSRLPCKKNSSLDAAAVPVFVGLSMIILAFSFM